MQIIVMTLEILHHNLEIGYYGVRYHVLLSMINSDGYFRNPETDSTPL